MSQILRTFGHKTSLFSNLTGTKYSYLTDTQVKILSNINSNVDYVQVVKTERKAYINSCKNDNKML